MSSVKNISKGSTDVEYNKKIQQALVDKGYDIGSTGVDGKIGPKTDAAIREFQRDQKIKVDGIAGKDTQGLLFSTNNAKAGTVEVEQKNLSDPDIAYPTGAVPKDNAAPASVNKPNIYGNMTEEGLAEYNNLLTQAFDTINQLEASRPGAYQYGADYGLANDYLSQYQNRDPFSYDFNSDALYNQYKDQYIQQGQMAMMDTMGQAAAMTGGYGNSYAQTVGQQMYNQYLGQLNEVMPELYGMAYDRYNQEGQDMLNMYDLYMSREQDNYNKYRDSVDMWNTQLSQAKDNYNTLYNEYTSAYDQNYIEEQDAKNWDYKATQDAKSEKEANYNKLANLIQSAGYSPSAEELKAAGMTSAEAKALKDAYISSINSGGGNYIAFTYEEQAKWDKEFSRASKPGDIDRIADRMEQAGIDPKIVGSWRDYYLGVLFPEEGEKTPTTTGSTGVGGGGGGKYVWEIK